MIISHENKYLFVQLPHTGCSAIARELLENYGGQPIHRKHTTYHRFLKTASPEEKSYFTFSGIRNPISETISIFYKLKTNHEGYDNPQFYAERGGFVTRRMRRRFKFVHNTGADFESFLKKYFKLPYDNWSRLNHRNFDFVMRFERLPEDFAEVLKRIGLSMVRPLPVYNPTRKDKKDPLEHFGIQLKEKAAWVFGPFMSLWGYDFPFPFEKLSIPTSSRILFNILGFFRTIYWRSL